MQTAHSKRPPRPGSDRVRSQSSQASDRPIRLAQAAIALADGGARQSHDQPILGRSPPGAVGGANGPLWDMCTVVKASGQGVSQQSELLPDWLPPEVSAPYNRALTQTIEAEIIPRLIRLHDESRPVGQPRVEHGPTGDHACHVAVAFCDLLLKGSAADGVRLAQHLIEQGWSLESLYIDVFAPTARRLGALWEADDCSFAQVTIALAHLQQMLRQFGGEFFAAGAQARPGPGEAQARVLLLGMPGEQHSFGLVMVSDFFHRAGWAVCCAPVASTSELARLVEDEWFDVIGLSLATRANLEVASSWVAVIRQHARNPGRRIMVGGPLFLNQPELVQYVGADAMASDARSAVAIAEGMLAEALASA